MKVLVVEPEKAPERKEIFDTLESMQQIVGGAIQAIYPFEEPVALICNDEGKLLNLPMNRTLYEIRDVICGTFFLCGAPPGESRFTSLTDEQIDRYTERFQFPEFFLRMKDGELCVLEFGS